MKKIHKQSEKMTSLFESGLVVCNLYIMLCMVLQPAC